MSNDLTKQLSVEDLALALNRDVALYNGITIGSYLVTSSDYRQFLKFDRIESHKHDEHIYYRLHFKKLAVNFDTLEIDEIGDESMSESDFVNHYAKSTHFRTLSQFIEYIKLANDALSGKLQFKEEPQISESTALVHASSKDTLQSLQLSLENKTKHLNSIKSIITAKMNAEKAKMLDIKRALESQVAIFSKQVAVIMKTIQSIELYLGINEDLFQLQSGEAANIDDKICFRQLILFMDEEVAMTDDGGLDYKDIAKFDRWLLKNDNFKKLLPESKGVVVFKPRRYSKEYNSGSSYYDAMQNAHNKTTYLLIRNGENLYRIYSENLSIGDKLFPKQTELNDILSQINETTQSYAKEKLQENADSLIQKYTRQSLLLQGLIDRSEVFYPLPRHDINIFKLEQFADYFQFIYDAESTLPSGRVDFRTWQRSINSKLSHGSRIIVAGAKNPSTEYGDSTHRYLKDYEHSKWSMPDPPSDGLYTIEKYGEWKELWINNGNEEWRDSEIKKLTDKGYWHECRNVGKSFVIKWWQPMLSILYHDSNKTFWRASWETTKQKRTRFKLYKDDACILNYDQISLDDINFYLENRTDRHNYLTMMPVLRNLKKLRLEELENEKHFVNLVKQQVTATDEQIWSAVEWWKTKNQWKRPIHQDDAKALRMITKHLSN